VSDTDPFLRIGAAGLIAGEFHNCTAADDESVSPGRLHNNAAGLRCGGFVVPAAVQSTTAER